MKMEPIIFNVKDKSAATFFEEHAIQDPADRRRLSDISPYYFMKDELYLKRSSGIVEGQKVIFELFDKAIGSGKELVNIYTYSSKVYDTVGILLTLVDFKVINK